MTAPSRRDKPARIGRISRVQPSAGTEFLPLVPPVCPHARTADAMWQTDLLDDLGLPATRISQPVQPEQEVWALRKMGYFTIGQPRPDVSAKPAQHLNAAFIRLTSQPARRKHTFALKCPAHHLGPQSAKGEGCWDLAA